MKVNDCIVVTGANGLAGSAVVEHLRKRYSCVVPLTRKDCDLRDTKAVGELFELVKPKYIFHAAATVYGIMGNMNNQGKSYFDNTMINTNIIDAARLVGVEKIIVMGTNAVYPWPSQLPYREETIFDGRPHAAESGYGHAKRGMLAMLEAYKESYGMNSVYLVSGNLYGPRDRFDPVNGHVLPSLIWKFYQASLNPLTPVEIWGDGSATRDFLYSPDLANIVRLVMEESYSPPVMNIGSGKLFNIRSIAGHLCGLSGVAHDRIIWQETMPSGRPDCYAELSRLSAYAPHITPISTGLRETWDWYVESQR